MFVPIRAGEGELSSQPATQPNQRLLYSRAKHTRGDTDGAISVWIRKGGVAYRQRHYCGHIKGRVRKDGDNNMASESTISIPEPKFEIPPIDISKLIEMIKEQEKINEQADDEQSSETED